MYSLSVINPFAVRYPCECDAATASACEAEELRRRTGATIAGRAGVLSNAEGAAVAAASLLSSSTPAFDPRLLCDLRVDRGASPALAPLLLLCRRGLLALRRAGLAARCAEEDDAAAESPFLTLRGRERERVRATIVRTQQRAVATETISAWGTAHSEGNARHKQGAR